MAPLLALGLNAAAESRIVARIPVPGDGGWDYLAVDDAARRLYVSHGGKVDVVDLTSGKAVAMIANTPGVHGIVIVPELGRGFTSNGKENTVTIFDRETLAVIGSVKTGRNPDAMLYDPATRGVFVFNGASKDATVIDTETGAVTATLPLGGKPEYPVTDGAGTIWVNIEDTGEIVRLHSATLKIENRWKLGPCEEPSSLAFDRKNNRLFAGCGNKMMAVVDGGTGKLITTVPIGQGVDGTVFDTSSGRIYNACGEGVLSVVEPDNGGYRIVQTLKTERGARTITQDPSSRRLYLPVRDGSFHLLVIEP